MTTAGRIGLSFQNPGNIIRILLDELGYSPGTLYAWLHTDNGVSYLKGKYGHTIKMDFEGYAATGQSDVSEVPVVR